MRIRKAMNIVLSSVIIASGLVALPVQEAHASQARKGVPAAKITAAGHGTARYDWLARARNKGKPANLQIVTNAPLGNGSWICSAAGFGQQSKCYRR